MPADTHRLSDPISLKRLKLAASSLIALGNCYLVSGDFSELTLEELAAMPVIESSKTGAQLFDVANGAFVFDEDAIRNLPVDSIPEMLRYAPGTHMMKSSNGTWGLGLRGMNSRFLGRSLFTVDEQSQYGTIFSGLFGSDHDLLLSDVASVEVVYGPGGTLWGTNAANGRVNVILKSVFETEGTSFKTRTGNANRSIEARHGWLIDEQSGARVWAKHSERQSRSSLVGDDWTTSRAGLRYEKRPTSEDLLSFSAEAFDSELGYSRTIIDLDTGLEKELDQPETQRGFNAQVKWTREWDKTNGFSVRSWITSSEFRSAYADYDLGLFGLEIRTLHSPSERHQFILAAGMTADDESLIDSPNTIFIDNFSRRNTTAHMGGEYTLMAYPDKVELSLGMSGSYESQSDSVEPLPSARIKFLLSEDARAWIAYSSSSRAIPSGIKSLESMNNGFRSLGPIEIPSPGGNIDIDTQVLEIVWQDMEVENERLDALEIGYRKLLRSGGSFALTAFANEYNGAIGFRDRDSSFALQVEDPYILSQLTLDNIAAGHSYGLEASRNWIISERKSVIINYSLISDDFRVVDKFEANIGNMPILDSELDALRNNVPKHLASLWYSESFERWRLDIGLRYNSAFSSSRSSQDESLQGDVRLSWNASDRARFSIVGRNLLDSETDETRLKSYIGTGSRIGREAYLEMDLKF